MPVRHGLLQSKKLEDQALLCTTTGQVMLDFSDARSLMDVDPGIITTNKKQARASTLAREYFGKGLAASRTGVLVNTKAYSPGQVALTGQFLFETQLQASINRSI